jgi:hypothetical protein
MHSELLVVQLPFCSELLLTELSLTGLVTLRTWELK